MRNRKVGKIADSDKSGRITSPARRRLGLVACPPPSRRFEKMMHDESGTSAQAAVFSRRRLVGAAAAASLGGSLAVGASGESIAQNAGTSRFPFPRHLVYAPGAIRPNHRTQLQQDDDVRAAYDRWKAAYIVAAGTAADGEPVYRVALGKPGTENHATTVSEGQGFGMVIVAHLAGHDPDAREVFDGLWRFARTYPSGIDPRLMSWHIPIGDTGNDSAFDGDCDMAYALLLADRQWGSDGPTDYRAAGEELLDGILESTTGPSSHLPLLGDWVDPAGDPYSEYTPRTSDFMLGHFRAFERASKNTVWSEVVAACQGVVSSLQANHSPGTGLLPDFVQPVSTTDHTPRPADPDFLEGPHDGHYYYNAGRDPWRLGTDAVLNDDAASISQARTIARWAADIARGNPTAIRAGYTLDGTPVAGSDYVTTFFVAPFGVAAMTDERLQPWLNDVYDAVRDHPEDYYEDSVTLLCLLVMAGNFWDPTAT
ncbi:MAG: glycosyl hydrolase family 8 [Thermomicrobiales bacterium]